MEPPVKEYTGEMAFSYKQIISGEPIEVYLGTHFSFVLSANIQPVGCQLFPKFHTTMLIEIKCTHTKNRLVDFSRVNIFDHFSVECHPVCHVSPHSFKQASYQTANRLKYFWSKSVDWKEPLRVGFKVKIVDRMQAFDGLNHYDTVLKMDNEEFYVVKKHLANCSTYLNEKFNQETNGKIELTEIDSFAFQTFLEVLHGAPITDINVRVLLSITTVLRAFFLRTQCMIFLRHYSKISGEEKSRMAEEFDLPIFKYLLAMDLPWNIRVPMELPKKKYKMGTVFSYDQVKSEKSIYLLLATHFNFQVLAAIHFADHGDDQDMLVDIQCEHTKKSMLDRNSWTVNVSGDVSINGTKRTFAYQLDELQSHWMCTWNGKVTKERPLKLEFNLKFVDRMQKFDSSTHSDVILKIDDEEFYVVKKHLANCCEYFHKMFYREFKESEKDKVEIHGIDSYEFQNFLEVLHGAPARDDTTCGLLKLADFFDAPMVRKNCENFLLGHSQMIHPRKEKLAVEYNLTQLKKVCEQLRPVLWGLPNQSTSARSDHALFTDLNVAIKFEDGEEEMETNVDRQRRMDRIAREERSGRIV